MTDSPDEAKAAVPLNGWLAEKSYLPTATVFVI
jgi:hypothetical protein